MTIANIITIFRFGLIGVFVAVFLYGNMLLAMCIFVLASVLDVVDGMIARRMHQVTQFGKLMDPLADKLMQLSAVLCLYTAGRVALLPIILLLVKEAAMIAGGALLYKRQDVVVYANTIGKAATFLLFCAITMAFFSEYVTPWHTVVLYGAVALSYAAGIGYAWIRRKALGKSVRGHKRA